MGAAETLDRIRAAYEQAALAIERDDLEVARASLARITDLTERLEASGSEGPAALQAAAGEARTQLLELLETERDRTATAIAKLRQGRRIVDRLPDSVRATAPGRGREQDDR